MTVDTTAARRTLAPAVLITLGVLSAFGPLSLDLYLPALPKLADDLGVAKGAAAITVPACMIGLASGQLVAGPLSDRLGRRRPLLVGLVAFVAASALCALAPALWFLVVARVLQGASGAAGLVIGRAIVRDLAPTSELARIFSLLMLVMGVAPIVAPVLGSGLVKVMPWRGLFVVLAGIGVCILLAAVRFLSESLPEERRHAGGLRDLGRTVRTLVRDRLFVGACLALGFGGASMFAYISLSSFVMQDGFGLSATQFAIVFASNAAGLIGASQLNARLVRAYRPAVVLGAALTVMLLANLVLVTAASLDWGLPVVLPALWVAVSMTGLVTPNATALALAHHARSAGMASALLGALQFTSGALGGAIGSAGGTDAVSMSVTMLGASALAWLVWAALVRRAS